MSAGALAVFAQDIARTGSALSAGLAWKEVLFSAVAVLAVLWAVARPHVTGLVGKVVDARFSDLEKRVKAVEDSTERLANEGREMGKHIEELQDEVRSGFQGVTDALKEVSRTTQQVALDVNAMVAAQKERERLEMLAAAERGRRSTDT